MLTPSVPSDVQLALRPGIVEFGWGHPDPALLPVSGVLEATQAALAQAGPLALAYGAEQGPSRLIEALRARMDRLEGVAIPREQVMVTGGASQALDMLCTLLTRPGDVALVAAPVYHLALRILQDHGLELRPVASDDGGMQVEALEEALVALQREGRAARLLYLVPTFSNPGGTTMSVERRVALVELAQRAGLPIVEDDVYRELWYDAPAPPSLFSLASVHAAGSKVMRLGSFSKILAPGLRLGWLTAPSEIVQRCTGSGLLDSGGGVNHFTAHVAGAFVELGLLDRQVERLREVYRQRRDALLAAMERYLLLPPECSWARPGGGFFVWLRLPRGTDSSALLARAEAAGVSYVPGPHFYAGGGGAEYCRLAFALLSAEEMEEGIRRLGETLRRRPE